MDNTKKMESYAANGGISKEPLGFSSDKVEQPDI